ncbi:unnamed protein product [Durusdinium trenchii]|uniref:Uncharacterized protein n=1 Tax=Durusdinium trenchii TaxID=1381693 RepID=A0ABP0R745_9DINO
MMWDEFYAAMTEEEIRERLGVAGSNIAMEWEREDLLATLMEIDKAFTAHVVEKRCALFSAGSVDSTCCLFGCAIDFADGWAVQCGVSAATVSECPRFGLVGHPRDVQARSFNMMRRRMEMYSDVQSVLK